MWYPTCTKVGFKFQYKSKANYIYFFLFKYGLNDWKNYCKVILSLFKFLKLIFKTVQKMLQIGPNNLKS